MKSGITNSRSEKCSAGLQILRNGTYLNNAKKKIYGFGAIFLFWHSFSFSQQFANYVFNGSAEQINNCNWPNDISKANGWRSIDSVTQGNGLLSHTCLSLVPNGVFGFQYPRTGDAYIFTTFLCQPTMCPTFDSRGYLRNRLKSTLTANAVYCVKFYANVSNNSSYGIDGIGAYFGDDNLDTITKFKGWLTYLQPQIQSSLIITDTLNWTLITGTFTANGTEKHLVIGNFNTDANTGKTFINSYNFPNVYSNILIDDVSCIPLDLPAYAYSSNNVYAIPGNTLYLGRQRDVGIDEACMWYKLPNTSAAIDTAAGITITVAATTETYMVKQDICGMIKYDTVIVHASVLGFNEQENKVYTFSIFPNPASETIFLSSNNSLDGALVKISDVTGKVLIVKILDSSANLTELPLNLIEGMYFVSVKKNNETANFKLFVAK